jgi:hypothetical protein
MIEDVLDFQQISIVSVTFEMEITIEKLIVHEITKYSIFFRKKNKKRKNEFDLF